MRIGNQNKSVMSFGTYKAAMFNRYEAKLSRENVVSSLSEMTYESANAFYGVVLDNDGNAVFIPYSYDYVAHLDVSSGVVTYTALTSTASSRFAGGCLADNGKIIFAPSLHQYVGIYDPATKQYTDGPSSAGKAYRGAISISPDLVILLPYNHSNIGLYNPKTNLLTMGATTPALTRKGYEGGCLLPDGRVFLTPSTHYKPAIYNPSDDTIYEINTPVSFGLNWFSQSICLPNGWVVLCPGSGTKAYIFDSRTETWLTQTITVAQTTASRFRGACLMQNGDICLIPYVYDYVGRLKIDTLTYEDSVLLPNSDATYQFGALLPDGRIIMSPYMETSVKPVPVIYNGCNQGVGVGNIAISRFLNHK